MYTMKDFLDGKIAAVISNQRQWNDFIDLCEKHGATFGDNYSAKEWSHDWKHKKEVIYCRGYKRLKWGFEKEARLRGEKRVHVNKLLFPAVEETGKILNTYFPNGFPPEPKHEPQAVNCRCVCLTDKPSKHPRYKIVIECAADITFATMYVDDEVVKIESAKRNPADKFNWRIGAQTAFNRLWEKKKKPKPAIHIDDRCRRYIEKTMKQNEERYKKWCMGEW